MKWMTFVLLCVASLNSFAQFKWEYGVQGAVNSSNISRESRDTFSAEPGFSFNWFLERKFQSFNIRSELGYKQNRYSNGPLNRITTTHAQELILKGVHPIDSSHKTYITWGIIGAYASAHNDIQLSGKKLPASDKILIDQPMHFGGQVGFELELATGRRLTIDYSSYLNAKQSPAVIQGRIGHLSLGLEYRIREYSNSKTNLSYFDSLKLAKLIALQHKDRIMNSATMIFVLRANARDYFSLTKTTNEIVEEYREAISAMISTIHSSYTLGNFIVTLDSFTENTQNGLLKHIDKNQNVQEFDLNKTDHYYALIDVAFLELNGPPKWGLFIYDNSMNRLNNPFPFYTPYKVFDTDIKSINTLISDFTYSVKLLN